MKKHTLSAKPRTTIGHKVKQLRKAGFVPATVYGKNIKSTSVAVASGEFSKVYKETGETGLIELTVDGDVRPVLIHTVQVDPVNESILHIEFHQVDLKEKVTAKVPVEFVGESPAVAQKLGVLLTVLDEIEVEALPTDLPEHISVDISQLAEVNAEIKVNNIETMKGMEIKTDPDLTVVKIGSLVTKAAEEQVAAEEAAAAAAKTTEVPEAAEGEEAAPTTPQAPPAKTEEKPQ